MSVPGESREIDALGLGGVAAIGNFDGVHRGHQSMVATLRSRADELGAPAVAVTFDPPPIEILRPEVAPPRLMTLRRRMHFLKVAGADHVVVLRTDRELLSLSAEQFFDEVLLQGLKIRGLVEGPNFRFGKGREGDADLLGTLCERNEIPLSIIEPTRSDGQMVSSSLIRQFVGAGDLRTAMQLLGRPHEVTGIVERGAGRGAALGFPTANLAGISTLLPPDGVYAARTILNGLSFPVAVHIGPNRTFGESRRTFEAHILDFNGDLYGRELCIELVERVRETNRFDSAAALASQMKADCERIRTLVADAAREG
jgi:riboflavin kinase / FMN adenylyltransferase